ncbi:MAG: hypothetical protein U1E51_27230, partial [Candidatus Binatia bacterium]|nr:hypothetical protein [Candidatus Binatia bacterium]
EPAKEGQDSPEDSENAGEDQEAVARKNWCNGQLQSLWGENFDREGEKVGRMVNAVVDFQNPAEAEFFDVVSEKLGNNASWINSLAIFAGSLPLGSRPIDVSKISKDERQQLIEKLDAESGGALKKAMPQMNKTFEDWLVRAAALKFHPPEFPPEPPDTKPAPPVDPKKARAAQADIDEIYSGTHKLSEAWKKGDPRSAPVFVELISGRYGRKINKKGKIMKNEHIPRGDKEAIRQLCNGLEAVVYIVEQRQTLNVAEITQIKELLARLQPLEVQP